MTRWIQLAATLYPRDWRNRYGEEFAALLEETRPTWRQLLDVLKGAFTMQITHGSTYWKLGASLALAGALVAFAVSFSVPDRYVSSAVLRFTPDPALEHSAAKMDGVSSVAHIEPWLMSRTVLEGIMRNPSLDLYAKERQRKPMGVVVQEMRRDIQIVWLPSRITDNSQTFRISFAYPDRKLAQAVVTLLTERFVAMNLIGNKLRSNLATEVLHSEPPTGNGLDVIEPAHISAVTVVPNRLQFAAWGLAIGLVLGFTSALTYRQPKFALRLTGFAAAGLIVAAAISFLVPASYTSTAVMRVNAPLATKNLAGSDEFISLEQWLEKLEPSVLSSDRLTRLVIDRNLYAEQRRKTSLEEIVNRMRVDDLHVWMQPAVADAVGRSTFNISFTYPDKYKAQVVTAALVSEFATRNMEWRQERTKAKGESYRAIAEHQMGLTLDVLDPASLPESATGPNRLEIAAGGLLLGLILGSIVLYTRQSRTPILRTA